MALSLLRTLALTLVLAASVAAVPAFAAAGGATPPATVNGTGGGAGYGEAVAVAPTPASGPSGGANAGDPKLIAKAKARARAKAKAKARSKAKARARARAKARRKSRTKRPTSSTGYVFPLAGPYTTGPNSHFGAGRTGHIHQGQDLSAAEGTAVLAPHAGTVTTVAYQAKGAGHYIVIDGAGEDRDYVFMHLRTATTLVGVGQAVRAGQKIAEVGSTGGSSGPHLHFEIWTGGPWQQGGRPIDPLPLLLSWKR